MRWGVPIMSDASFLSPGLFKSSLRRFWPLWLAGFVVLFLMIDLPVYAVASQARQLAGSPAAQASMMDELWAVMGLLGWLYAFVGAIVVAIVLNDHLFDACSATFIGSLPVRRGAVFGSVLAAGTVVLVGLPAAAALLMLPLGAIPGSALGFAAVARWLAVMAAVACVLYAFALLACHLSGSRAVALLLYGVMNLLAVCLEWAMRMLVSALMYGIDAEGMVFDCLSPAVWLVQAATGWIGHPGLSSPMMLAPYLLVALAVVAGSYVLYGRRNLETAGDSVAFAQIRPVLKYLAGISMSLLFGSLYRLISHIDMLDSLPMQQGEVAVLAIMMVVGASLGTLFAEMIMSRSTHVLGKAWRSGLVLGCAAVALVATCHFDALGIARHVPQASEVASVQLDCDYRCRDLVVSSPEGVAAACQLHSDLVAYGAAGNRNLPNYEIRLTYQLKNGRSLVRSYPVLSDYYAYRAGERPADEGARLIDALAVIANSQEGRASRFHAVFGADYTSWKLQVEYASGDGSYASIELPLAERDDFVQHALRPDLMDEPAGDVFDGDMGMSTEDYDVSVYVLEPVHLNTNPDDYTVVLSLWLSDERTPNMVAWMREHHPEIELRSSSGWRQ